jgi:hypothetical protein
VQLTPERVGAECADQLEGVDRSQAGLQVRAGDVEREVVIPHRRALRNARDRIEAALEIVLALIIRAKLDGQTEHLRAGTIGQHRARPVLQIVFAPRLLQVWLEATLRSR